MRPAKPNIMMNFRRIIQLTSSLAAALTLTACGGGGDTGPQWVQDLKDTIVYGELQLPAGAVYSPCSRFSGERPQSFIIINVIEKRSGSYYLTTKEEWYDDLGCSDSKKLYTLTNPKARLTYIGTGEDTTAGLTYQRVRSVSAGGNLQIEVEEDAPVTFTPITGNPSQVRIKFTSGAFFEYDQTIVFPAGAVGTATFAQDERSLYLGDPASAQEQVGDDSFPTKLKTDFPFRPYRFFSITPGTYANGTATTEPSIPDCNKITEVGASGAKEYGYISKVLVEPIDQDYRPQISIEAEYYSDLNCNNRLVTIKTPPILLETVGNGIDPTTGITYRQVLKLQQAGAFTATATSGDDRVTVTTNLVTFVNDGVTIPIGAAEAVTSVDSMYFKDLELYEGDPDSIDPATSFPTALLLEYPFFLLD